MSTMQQYFIGLPISKYEDFKTIIDRILSGSMMKDPRVEFEDITDTDSDDESTSFIMNETDRRTLAGGQSNELKIAELELSRKVNSYEGLVQRLKNKAKTEQNSIKAEFELQLKNAKNKGEWFRVRRTLSSEKS